MVKNQWWENHNKIYQVSISKINRPKKKKSNSILLDQYRKNNRALNLKRNCNKNNKKSYNNKKV